MAKKPTCSNCKRYTPSEKLPFKTWQRMCLQYTGWCNHYQEERDDDERTCNYYRQRKAATV